MTMPDSLHYFAYGSNMSLARLRARTPSAMRLGLCQLPGHDLRFHKIGRDGSGKCDAYATGDPGHCVAGALYTLDAGEQAALDAVEGPGYARKQVLVIDAQGREVSAFTYCAIAIDTALKPYSWYLNHVLVGARELPVPAAYLARLAAIDCTEDPDAARAAIEWAVHC